MAFLGRDDILVLEKNNGTVKRIVDGRVLPNSLLHVEVSTVSERGMLGIATDRQANPGSRYFFLYFTEGELKNVIFGQGFGAITDVKTGPDGYLYVLSIKEGGTDCQALANDEAQCIPYDSGVQGTIFRIVSD